jgi:hypothetical protein
MRHRQPINAPTAGAQAFLIDWAILIKRGPFGGISEDKGRRILLLPTLIPLNGLGTTCFYHVVIKIRQLFLRPHVYKHTTHA